MQKVAQSKYILHSNSYTCFATVEKTLAEKTSTEWFFHELKLTFEGQSKTRLHYFTKIT